MTAEALAALFAELAAAHPRIEQRDAGGAATFEVDGRPFAALIGGAAEFRLKPDIARAALRTPNTRTSERGPEWVVFAPPGEPDRYDVDRLRSWFEMAARLFGG